MAKTVIYTDEPSLPLIDFPAFPEGALTKGMVITHADTTYNVVDWRIEIDTEPVLLIKVRELDLNTPLEAF